jgi:hypothetical protein
VGTRAGLDGCGKSRPHRDTIPGSSSQLLYQQRYPGPCCRPYSFINANIKTVHFIYYHTVLWEAIVPLKFIGFRASDVSGNFYTDGNKFTNLHNFRKLINEE